MEKKYHDRDEKTRERERQEEYDADDKAYREWAAANPHDHSWLERLALDEFKRKGVRSFNPS